MPRDTMPRDAGRAPEERAAAMTRSAGEPRRAPVLEVTDLHKRFAVRGSSAGNHGAERHGVVHAVEGVSFTVGRAEVLAIVGESGCGKSTIARMLVGLTEPSAGSIRVAGVDLAAERSAADRRLIQLVPQNPWSALNRRRSIRHALEQALIIHEPQLTRAQRMERILTMLDRLGLAHEHLDKRPGGVSGGELARIVLARVLLVQPTVLVLDEPTASLDASIKANVVNLLSELRTELGLSMVVITHEIPVARQVADSAAVIYMGRIAEIGAADEVLSNPAHPYSRLLLESVPRAEPGAPIAAAGRGEVPSAMNPPSGCAFHPRCPFEQQVCGEWLPEVLPYGRRLVACHRIEEIGPLRGTPTGDGSAPQEPGLSDTTQHASSANSADLAAPIALPLDAKESL